MTRSSFSTSVSALKKQIKENRKKLSKSAKLKIILAMFSNNQNNVRPRKMNSNWIIHKSNSRYSSQKTAEVRSDNESDFERYQSNYDQKYVPIRTIRLIDSYEGYKPKQTKNPNKKIQVNKDSIKRYFFDFCEGTSLHGLRYVGVDNVTVFERLFWITAFVGAIGFSAFFISNIYIKWDLSPVIVGINPQFESISNIPFPAVTICNMNQAKKTEAEKILTGSDEAEKLLLDDICNFNLSETKITDVNVIQKLTDWSFIKKFILKVSQPCTDMLIQCKWMGYEIPCHKIFNSALTDEGVCCTFNRVATKFMYRDILAVGDFNLSFPPNNINWTPENGYPASATNTTWPYRAAGAGEHIGLTVITNVSAEQYYCSSTSSIGLKIRLHSPVESPMMADYGFFMHPRKEVRIAIRPTSDQASSTINKIAIHKRQCYFSFEKQLNFYRTYTKLNCELECLSNYTNKQCGCVPFYLPKSVNGSICDKSTEGCYRKAKNDMDIFIRPSVLCDCLPACNEIQYGQDHSLGDISRPELRRGVANTIETSNLIILHFFYQTAQFRSYEKSELFGFTEFLSNTGGLLGLFLGFSFLSIVEIIYYLTLRLWCVAFRKHKEEKNNKNIIYPFIK